MELVVEYLRDYDKLQLISTCKELLRLRDRIVYADPYDYDSIKHLQFLNNFRFLLYNYN